MRPTRAFCPFIAGPRRRRIVYGPRIQTSYSYKCDGPCTVRFVAFGCPCVYVPPIPRRADWSLLPHTRRGVSSGLRRVLRSLRCDSLSPRLPCFRAPDWLQSANSTLLDWPVPRGQTKNFAIGPASQPAWLGSRPSCLLDQGAVDRSHLLPCASSSRAFALDDMSPRSN